MGKVRSDYDKARKRVKAKKDFYQHLTSYTVLSIFFFLLNAVTSFGIWWFYWPMMGWGIGLLFHYFSTFGFPGTNLEDPEWEERAVEQELRRMNPNRNTTPEVELEDKSLELKELEKERAAADKKWNDSELV